MSFMLDEESILLRRFGELVEFEEHSDHQIRIFFYEYFKGVAADTVKSAMGLIGDIRPQLARRIEEELANVA